MCLNDAIETWKRLRDHVDRKALGDEKCHELVHEINKAIVEAIKKHEITYEEFERRTHEK